MRSLSLTLRQALTGQATDVVPVVLATITHPMLDEPVRLSTDPTQRLSVDPLQYGTVSRGETYLFALIRAAWPDDKQDEAPASQLVFENVAADQVALVRKMRGPATVLLEIVTSAAPDHVEAPFDGLLTVDVSYDANQITLTLSREAYMSEPWPCDRMTKDRFPGLF
ncbi:conserved hypothetical protein [Xanthobacter versatilis]|uniref:DUF1833 domain-containing protein n=1 Tax=Xanthobacter autotrophicus (strain ATCC BAA-1158 / Py2) TaxID=78245 RepID=A7ILQ2_XANP2|nr:conserved hypothetical protein [Xanthobacter autotrophicus Py2]